MPNNTYNYYLKLRYDAVFRSREGNGKAYSKPIPLNLKSNHDCRANNCPLVCKGA